MNHADERIAETDGLAREVHGPPVDYHAPTLQRWGTLRELTAGGGGTRYELWTWRRTRF